MRDMITSFLEDRPSLQRLSALLSWFCRQNKVYSRQIDMAYNIHDSTSHLHEGKGLTRLSKMSSHLTSLGASRSVMYLFLGKKSVPLNLSLPSLKSRYMTGFRVSSLAKEPYARHCTKLNITAKGSSRCTNRQASTSPVKYVQESPIA